MEDRINRNPEAISISRLSVLTEAGKNNPKYLSAAMSLGQHKKEEL